MSADQDMHSELLLLLHAGLFERPMWRGFLDRLRERTHVDHCEIHFRRADAHATEATLLSACNSRPAPMQELYNTLFHRLDPIAYDRLEVGRVYSLAEFIDADDESHRAYRDRYMIPNGMNYKRVMRVTGGRDYNAWITVWSAAHEIGAAVDRLLACLAPHVSVALQTYELIEHNSIRAHIADEAVRRLNFSWLTLDAKGQVVDIEPEAERLLGSIHISRCQVARRLRLPGLAAQRSLTEALRSFGADPGARPRSLQLQDDPGLDMLLLPMRERALSGARTPVLIAYLHGDSGPREQRIDQLVDLFRLTRGEARLALSLSRGKTIVEAARDLNLTVETARNYSKKIYSKMGARGQPDVVRIVLASVVALA